MKTIKELQKERLTIRTLDPTRASVLGLLIDSASKIAKEEHREATEKDIEISAKRMFKETEKDICLLEEHASDTSSQKEELLILKEFIPVQMDEATIRKLINEMPEEILVKKNIGGLMKEMKKIDHMDISLLSKLLNEILK